MLLLPSYRGPSGSNENPNPWSSSRSAPPMAETEKRDAKDAYDHARQTYRTILAESKVE